MALGQAASNGHAGIVKQLLDNGHVVVDAEDNYALCRAVTNGHTKVVILLLTQPNVDVTYGLEVACSNGQDEIAGILWRDGRAVPDSVWIDQLHGYGYHQGRTNSYHNRECNILKLLLDEVRIDPTYKKQKAFIHACQFGRDDLVRVFLKDDRIDPSNGKNAALLKATAHPAVVELLLADSRVDPTRFDLGLGFDLGALPIAVEQGHCETVKLFLADPRVTQCEHFDAVKEMALAQGDYSMIKLFKAVAKKQNKVPPPQDINLHLYVHVNQEEPRKTTVQLGPMPPGVEKKLAIEVKTSEDTKKDDKTLAVALQTYEGKNRWELSFQQGDVVQILYQDGDVWHVEHQGQRGFVQPTYFTRV